MNKRHIGGRRKAITIKDILSLILGLIILYVLWGMFFSGSTEPQEKSEASPLNGLMDGTEDNGRKLSYGRGAGGSLNTFEPQKPTTAQSAKEYGKGSAMQVAPEKTHSSFPMAPPPPPMQ